MRTCSIEAVGFQSENFLLFRPHYFFFFLQGRLGLPSTFYSCFHLEHLNRNSHYRFNILCWKLSDATWVCCESLTLQFCRAIMLLWQRIKHRHRHVLLFSNIKTVSLFFLLSVCATFQHLSWTWKSSEVLEVQFQNRGKHMNFQLLHVHVNCIRTPCHH